MWVDFGSGAGFPGIPIACALADKPGAMVHLVESVGKKANFLREVVRKLGIPAQVHQVRAEKFGESCAETVDVVTARALGPIENPVRSGVSFDRARAPSGCSPRDKM